MSSTVPSTAELDRWVEVAGKCEYLPENDLKVGRGVRKGAGEVRYLELPFPV